MKESITNGVSIKVNAHYQADVSQPAKSIFVHSYDIEIHNHNDFKVQLISRYWRIMDALGNIKIVEGEGVIGQQPILGPGQNHQYSSWCPINTTLGSMEGYYIMKRLIDGSTFKAYVPKFILMETQLMN